jgi:hypothetical protein
MLDELEKSRLKNFIAAENNEKWEKAIVKQNQLKFCKSKAKKRIKNRS